MLAIGKKGKGKAKASPKGKKRGRDADLDDFLPTEESVVAVKDKLDFKEELEADVRASALISWFLIAKLA